MHPTVTRFDLDVNELLLLQSELRDKQKSLGIAYLMLLGGHWGIHRFYLKRNGTGTAQLILFLFATISYVLAAVLGAALNLGDAIVGLFIIIFTFLPGLALFIWIIVDLFLMGRMVNEWNQRLEQETIQRIIALRSKTF